MLKDGILTSFGLKRVAMVSMVIDHIGSFLLGAMLVPYMVEGTLTVRGDSPAALWQLVKGQELCHILGRMAFPIFCFLVVEGFLHTRDRVGYGMRMGVFALLSEIPYDLVQFHTVISLRLQNVMFTLTVAIFTLLAITKVEERWVERKGLRLGATAAVTAAGMGVALLVRGEYVFLGVLAVVLVYLLRDRGRMRVLGLAPLLVVSPWTALAVPVLLLYNGRRGKGNKWFFYVFYPAHFLVFAMLGAVITG